MAHYAIEDRLNWAVLITGEPGTGYDSVGAELGSTSIEQISGYRTSHMKPSEWFAQVDKLKYHVTDPEWEKEHGIYFHGFGQNMDAILDLPWKAVFMLNPEDEPMAQRVIAFREKTPDTLKDGRDSKDVAAKLVANKRNMVEKYSGDKRVIIMPANGTPAEIASDIKAGKAPEPAVEKKEEQPKQEPVQLIVVIVDDGESPNWAAEISGFTANVTVNQPDPFKVISVLDHMHAGAVKAKNTIVVLTGDRPLPSGISTEGMAHFDPNEKGDALEYIHSLLEGVGDDEPGSD